MNILDILRGNEDNFEKRAVDASNFVLGLEDDGKTSSALGSLGLKPKPAI